MARSGYEYQASLAPCGEDFPPVSPGDGWEFDGQRVEDGEGHAIGPGDVPYDGEPKPFVVQVWRRPHARSHA